MRFVHGMERPVEWIKANWIAVTVVAVVVFVLWSTMAKKRKLPGDSININVRCPKCGWTGVVSKYAMTCRKCANKDVKPL